MWRPRNTEKNKNYSGYVIIYSVIILGMVILAASLYFSWLATFSLRSEISYRQSDQTRYLADTCGELALQQIWNNASYTGSGNFSGYGGGCTWAVSNLGGENRQINATGTLNNLTRKVKILVDKVNASVNVSAWREVADF